MNTQSTQSTLKAVIKNVTSLGTVSIAKINSVKPNSSLDTYNCGGCFCF